MNSCLVFLLLFCLPTTNAFDNLEAFLTQSAIDTQINQRRQTVKEKPSESAEGNEHGLTDIHQGQQNVGNGDHRVQHADQKYLQKNNFLCVLHRRIFLGTSVLLDDRNDE